MLQLFILAVVGLTAVYGLVSAYSRSVRRERLENEFDAGGIEGTREIHVSKGMVLYEKGLRKRLIVLVYVVPVALIIGIAYVVNHT